MHTTGSNTIEALSSSPTSSHTEYVPATSSASLAMLGPRQIAVPPTQSNQDTEDDDANMQVCCILMLKIWVLSLYPLVHKMFFTFENLNVTALTTVHLHLSVCRSDSASCINSVFVLQSFGLHFDPF